MELSEKRSHFVKIASASGECVFHCSSTLIFLKKILRLAEFSFRTHGLFQLLLPGLLDWAAPRLPPLGYMDNFLPVLSFFSAFSGFKQPNFLKKEGIWVNGLFLNSAALSFFKKKRKKENIPGISEHIFSICHSSFHNIYLSSELHYIFFDFRATAMCFFLYTLRAV